MGDYTNLSIQLDLDLGTLRQLAVTRHVPVDQARPLDSANDARTLEDPVRKSADARSPTKVCKR